MEEQMKLEDAKKGQRVKYIPAHAQGDPNHKDCETGVVKSKNDIYIFVIYDNLMGVMTTGDEPYTPAATRPEDLTPW